MGKKMVKRPFVEFILQLINIIFTLCGLGILGYGLLCLVKWKQDPSKKLSADKAKYMVAHRLLLSIDSSKPFSDSLPRAWFIYLVIGIGGFLFIISCFGYYCVLLVQIFLVEIGLAVLILFKRNWRGYETNSNCDPQVISRDESSNFHTVFHFMDVHWKFIRWIALAILILQVIAMILAVYSWSVIKGAYYDDDDGEPISYLPCVTRNPNWKKTMPITTTTPTTLPTHKPHDQTMPRKSPATAAASTVTSLPTVSAQYQI